MDQDALMVANVLQELGFDPRVSRIQGAGNPAWIVSTGGVALFVSIDDRDGSHVLLLDSPLVYMPPQDLLSFYRKLLGLNMALAGEALAMDKDVVHLVREQILEGLAPATAARLLQAMLRSADALGDLLLHEFPSSRYWSPL